MIRESDRRYASIYIHFVDDRISLVMPSDCHYVKPYSSKSEQLPSGFHITHVKRFDIPNIFLLLITAVFYFAPAPAWGQSGPQKNGDILQFLVPSIAYAGTFVAHDADGRKQFYESFLASTAITYGLKTVVDRRRPGNNSNHDSFPSGHTSAVFAGAAFVDRRYGIGYAIPLYVAATYTGWSRVESRKHYWSDVIAGAGIGIISSYYFTDPYRSTLVITPAIGYHYRGIGIAVRW